MPIVLQQPPQPPQSPRATGAMPKLFSLLHPSARPHKWREIYDAWMKAAKYPNAVEYVLCADERWGEWEFTAPTDRSQDKVVFNTSRRCYVDSVNTAAAASTGLLLVVIADDQYPCNNWDEELMNAITASQFRGPDYVISVSTGTPTEHERGVMPMPIMSRPRYSRLGYVLYPEYESMYSDNDVLAAASADNVLINARHLVFPHRHPITLDPAPKFEDLDEQYRVMNRKEAYALGEKIFAQRRAGNFGRKNVTPIHVPTDFYAATAAKKKTIAVVLPGEQFSSRWVGAWTELLATFIESGLYNLEPLFIYSSSVYYMRNTAWDTLRNMRPAPDFILWMDDDNPATVGNVITLIADLNVRPELSLVAGWTWIAADQFDSGHTSVSVGDLSPAGITRHFPYDLMMQAASDLIEIQFTGFPLVLMRGDMLATMPASPFVPVMNPAYSHGMSGEDAAFCIRAHERGLHMAVDRRVEVPHLKLRPVTPSRETSPVAVPVAV